MRNLIFFALILCGFTLAADEAPPVLQDVDIPPAPAAPARRPELQIETDLPAGARTPDRSTMGTALPVRPANPGEEMLSIAKKCRELSRASGRPLASELIDAVQPGKYVVIPMAWTPEGFEFPVLYSSRYQERYSQYTRLILIERVKFVGAARRRPARNRP